MALLQLGLIICCLLSGFSKEENPPSRDAQFGASIPKGSSRVFGSGNALHTLKDSFVLMFFEEGRGRQEMCFQLKGAQDPQKIKNAKIMIVICT